jgi:hypothetical protein
MIRDASQCAKVAEAADVIGAAIAKHYSGEIDVYAVLGGLSAIAAEIISRCPESEWEELLAAWDETLAWVRQSLPYGASEK